MVLKMPVKMEKMNSLEMFLLSLPDIYSMSSHWKMMFLSSSHQIRMLLVTLGVE